MEQEKPQLDLVPIFLTKGEAMLFVEFQKRYQVLAHLIGCMDSLNILQLKNCSITLDVDTNGKVSHSAITVHHRT